MILEDLIAARKRAKADLKKETDPFQVIKRKKGRNEIDAEPSFFADL